MGDDLVLIDDLSSVFESRVYVVVSQIGVALQNSVDRVATRDHTQNIAHHDPSAAYYGFAATDFGVNFDTAHVFSLARFSWQRRARKDAESVRSFPEIGLVSFGSPTVRVATTRPCESGEQRPALVPVGLDHFLYGILATRVPSDAPM